MLKWLIDKKLNNGDVIGLFHLIFLSLLVLGIPISYLIKKRKKE